FSLYGTTYGGDGRTTFALPDLRGRVPLHTGQGPGLSNRSLGSRGGSETNVMSVAQMPSHSHTATSTSTSSSATMLRASSATGNTASPTNNVLADGRTARIYRSGVEADVDMDASSIGGTTTTTTTTTVANTGGNQAQNNMQPFLAVRACVALTGIYPSRN
ncbi:phage tail protein, partial [Hyphococcus sp.]|uniref:phage tail protein n=1 Tax=Hyphococcus sp. TaxID=2038636 RepID=UPI00375015E5